MGTCPALHVQMLEATETGEDKALASYRKALKQDLPQRVREVVERQFEGAQRNHDAVRAMRDSERLSHA